MKVVVSSFAKRRERKRRREDLSKQRQELIPSMCAIGKAIGKSLSSSGRILVTVLRQHSSLSIALCSCRSSIGVQARSVAISNANSRICDRVVTRGIGLTLVGEVLHTLPETSTGVTGKSAVTVADEVQVEGEILIGVIEAVEGVLGTLLDSLIGSKHLGEVCDYRREVVRVVGVSGIVHIFGVTASSVEAFVRGVANHDVSRGGRGGLKRAGCSGIVGR
jgi:hypothetical protein